MTNGKIHGERPTAWAFVFGTPIRYALGVRFMEALHAFRVGDNIPDILLLMQHLPVVTLGRRARDQHLRIGAAELASRGIELQVACRGGDVTYHGPGQWVLYPIFRLGHATDVAHSYLWMLEEIAIRAAAEFGVAAFRRPGMSGAWTAAGKIAAIGFYIRRWVTMHGMSFNVSPDLSGFETIVPCGLVGERVASLATILGGRVPSMEAVGKSLLAHAGNVLRREMHLYGAPAEMPPDLGRIWLATANDSAGLPVRCTSAG